MVVPFAPGGNTDVMARMASSKLAAEFKQTFVVENRVGAGGALAAAYVAQAAPDGYTLLFGAAPQIAVVPKIQKVNYDPLRDFLPVSVFGTGPFILAINAATPAKTLQEYVAWAKARKGNYGSGGTGSIGHLSGALLVARAGIDATHVPFSGGAPAVTALLGGQIDMYFGNASELIPAGAKRPSQNSRRCHRQAHEAASRRANQSASCFRISRSPLGTASSPRRALHRRSSTSWLDRLSLWRVTRQSWRSLRSSVSRPMARRRRNSSRRSRANSHSSMRRSRPRGCCLSCKFEKQEINAEIDRRCCRLI